MKTPKNPEVIYRNRLNSIVNKLKSATESLLIPALNALEKQYVGDAYAQELETVIDNLIRMFAGIDREAKDISSNFVTYVNQNNKTRFYESIKGAVGVDLQSIITNENLGDVLTSVTRNNVALVKSIPAEYFKNIESIIFSGVTQGKQASSMISQIRALNNSSFKRAKLIARDQTSKLNSALTRKRSTNLGVEEYIWRTSGDDRVRESHRRKNGKIFRFDSPPKDTGHPGEDIQCRCVAQPIIKV